MGYLFKSDRLGFRNWIDSDVNKMIAVSADPKVMEYFPAPATPLQTSQFIEKMQAQYREMGHCYFAVELLETNEFIGFIGLMYQDYDAEFTPCVDIGWRLATIHWDKGYATEGAKRCLTYALEDLKLDMVYSTAPIINTKSTKVMEKIGMTKVLTFIHPRLKDNEKLRKCALYKIEAQNSRLL